jgi:hypothetical protein
VIGQRQHPQDAILFTELEHAVGGLDARHGRFVREHHTLAARRGPGSEPDEGGVQLVELGGGLRAAVDPLEPIAVALAALHDRAARGFVRVARRTRKRRGFRPREAPVELHLAHDLGDFAGRQVAGERHEAGARGQQAECGWQVREVVRGQKPDPLT